MEKKIEICIGTDRQGGVRARLSLMIVEGEEVLSEQFHSVTINPGEDAATIRRRVEQHLSQSYEVSAIPGAPWPAIPDEEWDKVTGVTEVIQTPVVIQKTQERLANATAKIR